MQPSVSLQGRQVGVKEVKGKEEQVETSAVQRGQCRLCSSKPALQGHGCHGPCRRTRVIPFPTNPPELLSLQQTFGT